MTIVVGLFSDKIAGWTTTPSQMSPLLLGVSRLTCYLLFGEEYSVFLFPLAFIWPCGSPTLAMLKPKS